ncbi:MAG: cysteine desulfurase [Clostridiales bacterium]|nr:cysteine desulfurase [Clostridiales bacterium]
MNRTIYLDHAATTQPFPEVLEAMLPYYEGYFGNPSSAYELGEESKQAVEQARSMIAATLSVGPETIYFTSGGTEADNWALRYAVNYAKTSKEWNHAVLQHGNEKIRVDAKTYGKMGHRFANNDSGQEVMKNPPHIITTSIEHHAVLRTCEALEREGVRVTYLPVDREGVVNLTALAKAISPETVLISVMYANNEIGTLQPIRQAASVAKSHGILFHTDAVQAYGQIPIDPQRMEIDLLSASGHKLNGPKGIGFLYAGKGLDLDPMILGGSQERDKRAGTENVPGIVGLGEAARMSHRMLREKMERETALRNYMFRRLLTEIPDIKINGAAQMRLPNNVNCSIRGINGGAFVALMDLEGICVSAASACSTGSEEPSHVQLAIGNTAAEARSAVRITLGYETTREEIDYTVDTMKRLIEKLRAMES